MKRYIRASLITNSPDGVPPQRPTKEQLLADAYALRGKDLLDAIDRADESGNWYREDKRQKRQYIIGLIKNVYNLDPIDNAMGILDQIDTNDELLYIIYGLSPYNTAFKERFGLYNTDILYNRQREKYNGTIL